MAATNSTAATVQKSQNDMGLLYRRFVFFRGEVGPTFRTLTRRIARQIITAVGADVIAESNENLASAMAIVPTIEIPPDELTPYSSRKDILFLGGFQHPPNIDSLEYTLNEIFPTFFHNVNLEFYLLKFC